MTPANYNQLLEAQIEVTHWSEERYDDVDFDGDVWGQVEMMENLFKTAGLRVMMDKEPGLMATIGDDLVGATFYSTHDDKEGDCRAYSFDLAVLPQFQSQTVGYLLAQRSVQAARSLDCGVIRNWVINPKAARLLEKLGFEHDEEPSYPDGGYSTHMHLWL